MSESDELTDDEIVTLRAQLQTLGASIGAALEPLAAASAAVDLDAPIGRLSRMDAMVNQGIAQKNEKSLKRRQNLIGAALSRMDKDDYGFCLECDEPVGRARLFSRPEALYCLTCQSKKESA